MDLAELRIFKAVVEEGGITRAAERLHRVQSNVTTRIKQLEDDLGVQLFLREGKRLHLSPAGRTLLPYAERLLDLAEDARASVLDAAPRGVFRLGAMESTAAVRLPGPLADYHGRYPEVTIELRTGNPGQLAALILAGDLDAALVAEPTARSTRPPPSPRNWSSSRPRTTARSTAAMPRRRRRSPSSPAARTANAWRIGMPPTTPYPNASSRCRPTTPC